LTTRLHNYQFLENIPKNWDLKKVDCLQSEPKRNGIYKKKEFHGRGQKIINMGELFSYNFISNQEMKRVELNEKEKENYLLQDGDLIFARRSLVLEGSGKCSIIVNPSEPTTFESSIIRLRLKQTIAEPIFFYYLFSSPLGRALMASIASRTAVSGITSTDLINLKVPVPPLPTQKKIAAILSAYDDLIENNTRRIKIHEDMAQGLYREWFVEFHFPGHEKVAMVEARDGRMMPEGWVTKKIEDVCSKLASGGTPARKEAKYWADGTIDWYKTKELQDNFLFNSEEKISDDGLQKSSAKIFPDNTIIIALYAAPTLGRLGILTKSSTFNQATCGLIPDENQCNMPFIYLSLLNSREYFYSIAMGAAQQNINMKKLRETPIIIPDKEIMNEFSQIVTPIFLKIKNIANQNLILNETRDLLLPRLIEGEIDVSDFNIKIKIPQERENPVKTPQ